jgi:Cdc6-like AAA superfamily ATPase
MSKIQTDFIVGGVARDSDFYFHKPFIVDILDSLKKDNVLLLAPRRTGKTSIMYYLLDNCQSEFRVIHLNAEDLETPVEFYLSLIDAINEHQPEYLQKLASSWDLFKDIGNRLEEIGFMDFKVKLKQATNWEKDWKELAQQLIEKVILTDEPVLFIIDELPDMLAAMAENSVEDLKNFLHQFKKLRTAPKSGKIRWLVGGSVNITGTLDEYGLINLINDLKSEPLPAISQQEMTDFVSMMLDQRDVKYTDTLIPRLHELLGEPIPFFLQLFTQELSRYFWRSEKPLTLDATHADKVFQHALLGEAAHDKLQHYHSRIKLYYLQNEQEAAYTFLDTLSLSNTGISERALFNHYQTLQTALTEQQSPRLQQQSFKRLLLKLESDFYVSKQNDDNYQFNSYLLKTWWRKNWAYIGE